MRLEYAVCHQEDDVMGMLWNCGLLYMLCPEDSSAGPKDLPARARGASRWLRTGKLALWLGVSILAGVGVSRLG